MQEQYGTAAQIAKYLNCHYRTIENWAAQGLIEKSSIGYGLQSALLCQINKLETKLKELEELKEEGKNRLYEAEVRLKNAQADLKELDRDERKGLLVSIAQVTEEWEDLVLKCRAKLLSMPSKLALELSGLSDPSEIEVRLQEIVDEALKELSSDG